MTISNSIPYRFYNVSTGASFNDTQIDGVHSPCFYQVIAYDDLLTLQVNGSAPTFKIMDANDTELYSSAMGNITGSYYKTDFDMNFMELNFPTVKRFYISLHEGGVEVMRSEGIDIDDSTTIQIRYRNNTNFDGIEYEANPTDYFHLRVKAQFWKESYTKEFESYAKSNGEFTRVFDQRLTKKLLEIGYMPGYMHDKITRILMHDNIVIDGDNWIVQDEYENEKINRFALSKASVLLTKKEEIIKNIL